MYILVQYVGHGSVVDGCAGPSEVFVGDLAPTKAPAFARAVCQVMLGWIGSRRCDIRVQV